MTNKLKKVVCFILVTLAVTCLCFGLFEPVNVKASNEEYFVKYSVENTMATLITTNQFSGDYNVEFDMKINGYGNNVGFGIIADENKAFWDDPDGCIVLTDGNTIYTPWKSTGRTSPEPITNYDEAYYNNKMLNKVRVKMEIVSGDLTVYAKSLDTINYPNLSQNYVVIMDKLNDVIPENGRFGFYQHSVGEQVDSFFYGIKITDNNGNVLFEDDLSKNRIQNSRYWLQTEKLANAVATGTITLPTSPVEKENFVKFDVRNSNTADSTFAPIIAAQPLRGNYTVEFEMKVKNFNTRVGFGIFSRIDDAYLAIVDPESITVLTEGNVLETPFQTSLLSDPTPIKNYNENYYNLAMMNKVSIKMVIVDGDLTLYAKSAEYNYPKGCANPQQLEYVQIADTLTGIVPEEGYFGFYEYSVAEEESYGSDAYFYGYTIYDGDDNKVVSDDLSLNRFNHPSYYIQNSRLTTAINEGVVVLPDVDIEEYRDYVTFKMNGVDHVYVPVVANVALSGSYTIEFAMKIKNYQSTIGFGIMNKNNDAYQMIAGNSSLTFLTDGNIIYLPWCNNGVLADGNHQLKNASNAIKNYNENYYNNRMLNKVSVKMVVSDGGITVYAKSLDPEAYPELASDYIIIVDRLENVVPETGYFGIYLHSANTDDGSYLYDVKITDNMGSTLFVDDFSKNHFGSQHYWATSDGYTDAITNGQIILPTTVTDNDAPKNLSVSFVNIKTEVYVGDVIDFTPVLKNMPSNAVLHILVVDGNNNSVALEEDNLYTPTSQGYLFANYSVTIGEDVLFEGQYPLVVTVKNHSTQKSANVNFNDGYADGKVWEIVGSAGINDGKLIIDGGSFLTKGFSEIAIMTFDVVAIDNDATRFNVIFGKDNGIEYKLIFLGDKVTLVYPDNSTTFEASLNYDIISELKSGKTATIRISVASHKADLFVRLSSESVEVLETPVLSVSDIQFVGKLGVDTTTGNKIAVDDISFVNMSAIKDDNTNTDPAPDPITGINASDVSGIADGTVYSIKVTGARNTDKIYYRIENGEWSETNPTFTKAGVYTVEYKVTRANEQDYISSALITLTEQESSGCQESNGCFGNVEGSVIAVLLIAISCTLIKRKKINK